MTGIADPPAGPDRVVPNERRALDGRRDVALPLDALALGLHSPMRAPGGAGGQRPVVHREPTARQLLFWRPVPSFEPSAESMAPSVDMVNLQRRALANAVVARQLGPGADPDEALYLVSVIVCGAIGQALANEPHLPWGQGRFTPLLSKLSDVLVGLYPAIPGKAGRR